MDLVLSPKAKPHLKVYALPGRPVPRSCRVSTPAKQLKEYKEAGCELRQVAPPSRSTSRLGQPPSDLGWIEANMRTRLLTLICQAEALLHCRART